MLRQIRTWVQVLLLVAIVSPASVWAQGDLRGVSSIDAQVRAAFAETIRDVRPSVVELEAGDQRRVLGTVVDAEGYVLSKASELVGAESIMAMLSDGRQVHAQLVGVERKNDLALLKIDAEGLKPVTFAMSEPGVGRWLASVGRGDAPVAVGIVSAKARKIDPPQLVLGVALREHPQGLSVEELIPGLGADRAGVRQGDVLMRVGDKKVIAVQQVVNRLQSQQEGEEVEIELLRNGKVERLRVQLSELEPDPTSRTEKMNRMGGALSERRQGFERVLQHDAEIRPEHCGGPVVNLKGEVVGINIARAGRVATYALPGSLVKRELELLRKQELAPVGGGAQLVPAVAEEPGKSEMRP